MRLTSVAGRMRLSSHLFPHRTILAIHGELGLATAAALRERLPVPLDRPAPPGAIAERHMGWVSPPPREPAGNGQPARRPA